MEHQNYGEVLCQAVDEIITKRLEGISYDQTILCTIVDDSNKKEGVYIVTNNNTVKFEAYSDNTSYRKNDNVYVQIPGGDWNQQKTIISKKTNNTTQPFIYKSPFESLVDITGNIIGATNLTKLPAASLQANGEVESVVLWTYNLENNNNFPLHEKGSIFADYTRLGIQAEFKSLISPFYQNNQAQVVNQGDYGLQLTVEFLNEDLGKSTEYIIQLNTADMNGNPYDFQTYYAQEKVIDIGNIGAIQSMKLEFYQKKDSFKSADGTLVPTKDFLDNQLLPNLFVNDVYISLGYDVSEFNDEMVRIFSLDSSTYSKNSQNEDNKKDISLRWIHKTNDDSFISITNKTENMDYEIRWYRYELGAGSADEYSGVYWKRIPTDGNLKTFEISLLLNTTLQDERIKAIVFYNGQPYRSNILIFNNENEVVNKATIDAVQALSIVCVDKETKQEDKEIIHSSYGNYNIYNESGSLINSADASRIRKWIPYFKSSVENKEDLPTKLVEAEYVEWIIPTEKTMIVVNNIDYTTLSNQETEFPDKSGSYWIEDGDDARLHIKRVIPDYFSQEYRIKNHYSQRYSDNTIQCKISKNGIIYTAVKEMTFGIAGTSGSDCTLVIDIDNGNTSIVADGKSSISATVRLYDYENNEVDISTRTIQWSWKVYDNQIKIDDNTKDKQTVKLISNTTIVPEKNFNILQVTVSPWGNGNLIAYLPIPIRKDENQAYISGTTQIIYNANGEISSYFSNPFILYDSLAMEVEGLEWGVTNGVTGEANYTPKLIQDEKTGQYYLKPLDLYVAGTCEKLCVTAKQNGIILWSQPILILQNKFPFAMLSKWDGSLTIDEEQGTILAPRLAAGKKVGTNFSGVVIGDWAEQGDNSLRATGLYGFNNNELSYGFKDDGTAFIGKKGSGQIIFNGNKGTISSANGKMTIDIDDGTIKTDYFSLNSDGKISATAGNFSGDITGASGTFSGSITGASGTFSGTISSGTITSSTITNGNKFSVDADGNVTAKSITITDGSSISLGGTSLDSNGAFSSSNATLTGGSLNINNGVFTVNTNGHMVANSAEIVGKITANDGQIAGWYINGSCLQSEPSKGDGGVSGLVLDGGSGSIYGVNPGETGSGWAISRGGECSFTTGSKIAGWEFTSSTLSRGGISLNQLDGTITAKGLIINGINYSNQNRDFGYYTYTLVPSGSKQTVIAGFEFEEKFITDADGNQMQVVTNIKNVTKVDINNYSYSLSPNWNPRNYTVLST